MSGRTPPGSRIAARRTAAPAALAVVVAFAALALSGCGGGGRSGDGEPPTVDGIVRAAAGKNLLILLCDAAAAKHLGCYGYDRDTTPNIDRVARESVLFEQAYSQASGTMLSVFSFFTSRYPVFARGTIIDRTTVLHLPPDATTMAEFMAARYPHRLGFTANTWLKDRFGHARGFTDWRQLWDLPPRADGTDPADEDMIAPSLAWMRAHADGGFFAYLHFLRPHSPYDAPEPFLSRFVDGKADPAEGTVAAIRALREHPADAAERARLTAMYDGNLNAIDHALGALIDSLDADGIWDRTVCVIMADHGQAFFEHGVTGHGGPPFEEEIRVPLMIRVPGAPGLAGRRVRTPVQLVDLLPTLLQLVGVPAGDRPLAGVSLWPLVVAEAEGRGASGDAGEAIPSRPVFSRSDRKRRAVYGMRAGDLKLMLRPDQRQKQLFDLAADPGEKDDLWVRTPPPGAETLLEQLRAWIHSGDAGGSTAIVEGMEAFSEKEIERLRSLGYVR